MAKVTELVNGKSRIQCRQAFWLQELNVTWLITANK